MDTDLEHCKKIVNDFLAQYCGNDLEKLLSFDIGEMDVDDMFGKPKEYPPNWLMDPDDSIIARAVLYLIYHDQIKNLTYDMIGNEYRGDTIFTPGNIFGRTRQFKDNQYIENLLDCMGKVHQFSHQYHTLPNMMLLPNKKIEVIRKNRNQERISTESLNQYRGMNNPGLSDYIDLFIQEIYNCIENINPDNNAPYIAELVQENAFYFDEFKEGIQFMESHYLDDMVCKVENRYEIIEDYQLKHVVWWNKTENYAFAIDQFLNAFARLWKYRKEKMLAKLQKCLAED